MKFFKINKENDNFVIVEENMPLYLNTKFIKQILNENFNLDIPMDNVIYSNQPLKVSNSLRDSEVTHRNEKFYLYMVKDLSNILINGQSIDSNKRKMKLS